MRIEERTLIEESINKNDIYQVGYIHIPLNNVSIKLKMKNVVKNCCKII